MNNMLTIAEKFNSVVLQHGTTGATTTFVGYKPSNGVRNISIVCVAEMGNSTDMTITVKTADDSSGTNAAVLASDVPLYKATSGAAAARQTDAQAFTEGEASGTYIYTFEIPAALVPANKYIGVYADSGSASNSYSAIVFEDTYYKG